MPRRPPHPTAAHPPAAAGAPVSVRTHKMAAGGDAIGNLADGRVVFVDGALPDEVVLVDVHTSKRDYARAAVVEVVEPSPYRVVPPCPALAAGCGGCAWQHVASDAQLALKAAVVADALRRTAKLPDAAVHLGAAVPPWGYRTTLRLAVASDSDGSDTRSSSTDGAPAGLVGAGRIGLRAAGSHRVVPLADCPVAHPSLAAMLADVRVTGGEELSLRIGVASGEASAMVHGERGKAHVGGLPVHVGIGPQAVVHEEVAGVRLQVSAASFFQSGPLAAELLVGAVGAACGDALADDGTVLDAYGGCGLFAAALFAASTRRGQVLVVESSPTACADALANVPGARVVHSEFEHWRPEPVSLVVADPARAGLGRVAVDVIAATGCHTLVLVSCDPVSLARDARLLAAHGFGHEGSTVLDLFPHTPHVEVVTRFTR